MVNCVLPRSGEEGKGVVKCWAASKPTGSIPTRTVRGGSNKNKKDGAEQENRKGYRKWLELCAIVCGYDKKRGGGGFLNRSYKYITEKLIIEELSHTPERQ